MHSGPVLTLIETEILEILGSKNEKSKASKQNQFSSKNGEKTASRRRIETKNVTFYLFRVEEVDKSMSKQFSSNHRGHYRF